MRFKRLRRFWINLQLRYWEWKFAKTTAKIIRLEDTVNEQD